jgi:pyridoxamine 5'-phosphate oxidase
MEPIEKYLSSHPELARNPVGLFEVWLNEAKAAKMPIFDAMALATVANTPEGYKPKVRMVLFKGMRDGGLKFFTNFKSRKAADLAANPFAALTFHWATMERQIRFEGKVEKLSPAENDAYWASRPRESQLGGWSSEQSAEIPDRAFLEKKFEDVRERFASGAVPRPEFWGGYLLVPSQIEFWEGRNGRLHDRLQFTLSGKTWACRRLSP